jgi:hypothetical protein
MFGVKAIIPSSMSKKPEAIYNYDDYYYELRHKMQSAHEYAHENLIKSKEINKKYYDSYVNPHTFHVGDKVWLENPTHKKLDARYTGPYEVTKIISDTNVKIRVKNREIIIHINRLKPCID